MAKPFKEKNPRLDPYASLNKLGEYMRASAIRRRSIVREQKFPKTAGMARYTEARNAIVSALCDLTHATTILNNAVGELQRKTVTSEWTSETRKDQVAAIAAFLRMLSEDKIPADLTYTALPHNAESKVTIKGLEVSARPDVRVSRVVRGVTKEGLLKIHIAKNSVLDDDQMAYIGAFLTFYGHDLGHPIDSFATVYTLDVFGENLQVAPKSNSVRIRNIEAACEEIVLRWPSVKNS